MPDKPANTDYASSDALTYEQKVAKLEEILSRLDDPDAPIEQLVEDVKLGARLLKGLYTNFKQVEDEVDDAFKELEGEPGQE